MNHPALFDRRPEFFSCGSPLDLAKPNLKPFANPELSSAWRGEKRAHAQLLKALSALQTKLTDLAFDLEKRPELDAADLACVIARSLETILADASIEDATGPQTI